MQKILSVPTVSPASCLRCTALLASLSLVACAATPARSQKAQLANVDETRLTALYTRLDSDSRRYEGALDLARNGDTAQAQTEIKTALDDLRAGAAQCGQTPGCDDERFFATFDHLLRLDTGELASDAVADGSDGETPESTTEAGESSPVIAAVPELGRSVTLLKGRKLGDIIALNGPVKAALEQWLTQYRPNLIDAYENYEYLRYRMWPEYRKARLPEALLFGMLAKESGGKVHAVSRSGAAGPLQFMYSTGLRFGLTTLNGFDQRFDPTLSARANAAYLNEQLAIFNDNLDLVLGAYNGGEGRMQRLTGDADGSSFWDPKIYFEVSTETREYVPMVLAAAWLFMHPERYHLNFPKIDGRPGKITLKQPASIAELTVCLGQDAAPRSGWFRTLRNLNPQLDPQQRQPAGTRLDVPEVLEAAYAQSCAAGPWADLAAELHAANAPTPPAAFVRRHSTKTYKVRRGDTLAAIARRHGCDSVRAIAKSNGIRAPHYAIRAGQTLRLSRCSSR
ncbi:MAG: transglycosylase SLT domain-containing protein [Rhodanobacteraceae bacterium]